jgi:hypothetical protein
LASSNTAEQVLACLSNISVVTQELSFMKKRPMGAHGADVERRQSRRFPVVVPLEVSWRGPTGMPLKEEGVARQVNEKGGYLKMSKYPPVGTRVTLANFLSAQTAEARVLAAPDSRPGVANGVVVELIVPNENFWGADLQVKKTIIELQNLDNALKQEQLDMRLVREYRDAMDHVCGIAETLPRLRSAKPRGTDDDHGLFSALAEHRVRRAKSICVELIADVEAGRIQQGSSNLEELTAVIQRLQQVVKQGSKVAAIRPQ